MANTKFNRDRAKSSALWAMGIGAFLMMVLVVSFNAKDICEGYFEYRRVMSLIAKRYKEVRGQD